MTTALEKTLKRELRIDGRAFVVAISPESLKLTLKGKRSGLELKWEQLVSGEAALAVALNASVGKFTAKSAPAVLTAAPPKRSRRRPAPKRRA
jgi:hypothetical protein